MCNNLVLLVVWPYILCMVLKPNKNECKPIDRAEFLYLFDYYQVETADGSPLRPFGHKFLYLFCYEIHNEMIANCKTNTQENNRMLKQTVVTCYKQNVAAKISSSERKMRGNIRYCIHWKSLCCVIFFLLIN